MAALNMMLCAFVCLVLGLVPLALANGPHGECPCNTGQCCNKTGFCGTSDAFCSKANCASQCPTTKNCFPGDAMVELPDGVYKHMNELAIGDKVAVTKKGRKTVFEPVYAFGHKDSSAYSEFVSLELESMDGLKHKKVLELTTRHFVPVVSGPAGSNKRSMDVKVGDIVLASIENELAEFIVTGVAKVWKEGLYNPYTMGGTILVNGVFASAHSEWFLDAAFDVLGLTRSLPAAYQTILYPVRVLYGLLGHQAYATLYSKMDSLVNIAEFGTKHGGTIAGAAVATTGLFGYYALTNKKLKSY